MRRLLILIGSLFFTHWSASLQAQEPEYDFTSLYINEVEVFAPFTHREMVNHFGEPVAVYWAADTFYPLIYEYRRADGGSKSEFALDPSDRTLCAFWIRDSRFVINDFIRIGDPVSKVPLMGGTWEDRPNEDGTGGSMVWKPVSWEGGGFISCPAFHYNEYRNITSIELHND